MHRALEVDRGSTGVVNSKLQRSVILDGVFRQMPTIGTLQAKAKRKGAMFDIAAAARHCANRHGSEVP